MKKVERSLSHNASAIHALTTLQRHWVYREPVHELYLLPCSRIALMNMVSLLRNHRKCTRCLGHTQSDAQ